MRLRLLIVDDEKIMVEVIRGFMEPMCSLIDDADNLRTAVEMAKTGQYNIVLLDLILNGTGKAEAFAAIRTLKSYNCAVVVISGVVDPHLQEDAMAAGADAFVRKGGDMTSHKLLLAANIAVLHLPKESFKSDSFYDHVKMLRQMVEAA